jgi:hypothetical protein
MTDNNEMNDAEAALEHLRQKHGKGKTTPAEEPPKDLGATDNEPDADPEDTTEKPEDSPESGRKKTRNGPFKRLVDNHPRVTTGIILGVTALTIAIAATSVAYATQTINGKLNDVTGRYQTAQKSLNTKQDELQTALDTADATLASVTDEQVLDPNTLDNLKTIADEARPLLTDPGEEPTSDEFILQRIYDYEQLAGACDTQENEVAKNTASVNAGITAVNDSVTDKQRDDAMKATAAKVDEAKDILDKSKDAVLDDTNRNTLSGLIDEANTLVNNADATKEQFDDETNRLQGSIDSVNADMQAKVEHDEAVRKAEEEKKARGSASAGSNATDTWTPSYYNAYGTAEADANGALTQWADNYFVAHNWSANGKRILSRPAHVVINGTTYHYVSEKVVGRDTCLDDVEAFCYANNGIAFQTCYGANYLITHYEPGY